MRSALVLVLLLLMVGTFGAIQATRHPTARRSTIAAPAAAGAGEGAPRPAAARRPAKKTPAKVAAPKQPPAPRMKRPLRVVSLGWALAAPGVVANDGEAPGRTSLFSADRLQVILGARPRMEEVEGALARGGADQLGADVAILPLPELVASFERLRALAPQVFLVVGWSRGRDGLMVSKAGALSKPPRTGRVELAAPRGSSAALLGLFGLELAGVDPRRVSLLDPAEASSGDKPGARTGRRRPLYAALERPVPAALKADDELRFVMTTADARRLIPIVAVAPAGLIQSNKEALAAWARGWLAGVDRLRRDVPAAARRVSSLPQAPAALELLNQLGQIEAATLADNTRVFGLSARDPVTIEELFRRCWGIWRTSGVLSSPSPERLPVEPSVISDMARIYPSLVEELPPAAKPRDAAPLGSFESMLQHSPALKTLDGAEPVNLVGFLAGVFDRAQLTISVRGSLSQARALAKAVEDRFDLPDPRRLVPATHARGPLLTVEVAAPK